MPLKYELMQSSNPTGGDAVQFEPFTPPSMEELDALIPGYKFVDFIDRGGMGAVYKAVQKSLNRTVAVKLLPRVHRDKETFAERFKREAHALAQLNHPHIVAVHDFGETPDGQMYYAMEYVAGMDLHHLLRRDPPGPEKILRIIKQVCDALQFAHERGIVHRDIKPANILIDERGNVKVADFGLAKVVGPQSVDFTATGTTLGTPDYIAPEALDQYSKIDHRADIYSLGVMIYELLTGHVPKGVWEPPSIRSGADKRIDVVVSTAMQNNPEKRYQHVSDMTQVLEKLLLNSENWKNFRRPVRSEPPKGDVPSRIDTDAETIKVSRRKSRPAKRKWMARVAGMVILGAGLTTALQKGWFATPDGASKPAPGAEGLPPDLEALGVAPAQIALAGWVFAHDGFLNVQTTGSSEKSMGDEHDIWYPVDLPHKPFTIWRVSFAAAGRPITEEEDLEALVNLLHAAGTVSNLNLRGLQVPEAALGQLRDLISLTNLDLTASSTLTHEAVPFLAACTQLKLLRVGGTLRQPVDPAVVQELRLALPDCKILQD